MRAGGIFDALEEASVEYVVWKDVYEIEAFAEGDAELDIYVPSPQRSRFESIAREHGFACYCNFIDVTNRNVVHWIRFASGRYYHLHVHYSLLTGDHTVKELCLDPLFPHGWPWADRRQGIRVIPPEDELLIGVLRLLAKASADDSFKSAELKRLREIYESKHFVAVVQRLQAHVDLPSGVWESVRRVVEGDSAAMGRLREFRPGLDSLARIERRKVAIYRDLIRLGNVALYVLGLGNKKLCGRAPSIGIIGVDGSGKSTIARTLGEKLGTKISVRRMYLGGKPKTYSPLTWVGRAVWAATSLARKARPHDATANDLYYSTWAAFEYLKFRDRLRRLQLAKWLRKRGVVTVFERYPVRGLFDYPYFAADVRSGAIGLSPWAISVVNRFLTRIDGKLEEHGLPDIFVLADTPLETIASRRSLGVAERGDIERKLELLREYRSKADSDNFEVLRNTDPIETVNAALLELVNSKICSFN